MKQQGFLARIETEEPFTHMAGHQRWDLRVRITYRDAPSAVVVGGTWDKAFEAAKASLYPDKKKLDEDEARRFSLLEEHWGRDRDAQRRLKSAIGESGHLFLRRSPVSSGHGRRGSFVGSWSSSDQT